MFMNFLSLHGSVYIYNLHVCIFIHIYIHTHNNYPFRGGRTQIARHNLDVFEGGGPGKCQQAFIFSTFYLQNFLLIGPLILYGILFIFLKSAGGAFKM